MKLASFTAQNTQCSFKPEDVVVVYFGREAQFEPAEVVTNNKFPNNLQGTSVKITGDLPGLDAECFLVADTIAVTQTNPGPSPTGTAARRRTSPSPTRPAAPTTATATATANGGQETPAE